MNDPYPYPYLYLIMRGDMPSMNPGKLAAQAAHGASMFHEYARNYREDNGTDNLRPDQLPDWFLGYEEWVKSAKNFGTTIVLSATKDEMKKISENIDANDSEISFVSDFIIDPSYPFTMETEIFNYINEDGVLHGFENVSDLGNGRTFATREEMTGFWCFGSKTILQPVLGHLKLYP